LECERRGEGWGEEAAHEVGKRWRISARTVKAHYARWRDFPGWRYAQDLDRKSAEKRLRAEYPDWTKDDDTCMDIRVVL
jgi:hypothetical protein